MARGVHQDDQRSGDRRFLGELEHASLNGLGLRVGPTHGEYREGGGRDASSDHDLPLRARPGAEQPAHHDQLAHVVGGVVDDQQDLAQVGLTGAVRDRGQQMDVPVRGEALQRPAIAAVAGVFGAFINKMAPTL